MAGLDDKLDKYLRDVHSIEEQALQQLRSAPKIAGEPGLSDLFEEHLTETREHERLVSERLTDRGSKPSAVKDAVMRAGGTGFILFARSQPDTPGKLLAHAFSYEGLEEAAYEILIRVAERAGDDETVRVGQRIREQERSMIERLSSKFDAALEASLEKTRNAPSEDTLATYLADAHAIESQAITLLQKGPKIAGDPKLAELYAEHLEETKGHADLVERRLEALGAKPSTIKDAALRLGALNWGLFFQAQSDTPTKLAAFAYAFEHLEIAGYELLLRLAQKAGDRDTVDIAQTIMAEERSAASKLAGAFDAAVEASLGTA